MDIDLDDDLVFENDIIKKSLNANLEQVKLKNMKLEEKIKERRLLFSNLSKSEDIIIDVSRIRVKLLGKKIYNNKYIFYYEVENGTELTFTQCKVYLQTKHFSYDVHIIGKDYVDCKENCQKISNEFSQTTEISKTAFIVLVFNTPQFTDKLYYKILGNLLLQQAENMVTVALPDLELSASDITSKPLTEITIESGDIFNLFTVLFCSVRTDFVMIMPNNFSSVNNIFETHCFLTALNVESSCKKYFASIRVCSSFDSSLIAVHTSGDENLMQISFYTNNDNELVALLHFLYQNISELILIPASCSHNYDLQKIAKIFSPEDEIEKFTSCFGKEIGVLQRYKQYWECGKTDCDVCMGLQKRLLEAQKNTDLCYLKITTGSSNKL